jgi:hypothetical protein
MATTTPSAATPATVARLEARIAALESALERRSQELRAIQRHVCKRDLALISRIQSGLPPLPPPSCDLVFWRETTEMTPADVGETLEGLWSSLTPLPGLADDDGG